MYTLVQMYLYSSMGIVIGIWIIRDQAVGNQLVIIRKRCTLKNISRK